MSEEKLPTIAITDSTVGWAYDEFLPEGDYVHFETYKKRVRECFDEYDKRMGDYPESEYEGRSLKKFFEKELVL